MLDSTDIPDIAPSAATPFAIAPKNGLFVNPDRNEIMLIPEMEDSN
ncbi:MAG: hypothetical protein QXX23_06955 [Thermoplasmata archaeon]